MVAAVMGEAVVVMVVGLMKEVTGAATAMATVEVAMMLEVA
jgi:hypothetical protein